jgi:hypothetical protein
VFTQKWTNCNPGSIRYACADGLSQSQFQPSNFIWSRIRFVHRFMCLVCYAWRIRTNLSTVRFRIHLTPWERGMNSY